MIQKFLFRFFGNNTVQENNDSENDISVKTSTSPFLEVDFDTISGQTKPTEVLQVRVLKDGQYINYWISIGTNRNNRVICEVATNVATNHVRKSVQAGAWRDAS